MGTPVADTIVFRDEGNGFIDPTSLTELLQSFQAQAVGVATPHGLAGTGAGAGAAIPAHGAGTATGVEPVLQNRVLAGLLGDVASSIHALKSFLEHTAHKNRKKAGGSDAASTAQPSEGTGVGGQLPGAVWPPCGPSPGQPLGRAEDIGGFNNQAHVPALLNNLLGDATQRVQCNSASADGVPPALNGNNPNQADTTAKILCDTGLTLGTPQPPSLDRTAGNPPVPLFAVMAAAPGLELDPRSAASSGPHPVQHLPNGEGKEAPGHVAGRQLAGGLTQEMGIRAPSPAAAVNVPAQVPPHALPVQVFGCSGSKDADAGGVFPLAIPVHALTPVHEEEAVVVGLAGKQTVGEKAPVVREGARFRGPWNNSLDESGGTLLPSAAQQGLSLGQQQQQQQQVELQRRQQQKKDKQGKRKRPLEQPTKEGGAGLQKKQGQQQQQQGQGLPALTLPHAITTNPPLDALAADLSLVLAGTTMESATRSPQQDSSNSKGTELPPKHSSSSCGGACGGKSNSVCAKDLKFNLRDPSLVLQTKEERKEHGFIRPIRDKHRLDPNGYGWKKYSHKVIKRHGMNRLYYHCSAKRKCNCTARKYVDIPIGKESLEKVADDVVYEGEHNHPPTFRFREDAPLVPVRITKAAAPTEEAAISLEAPLLALGSAERDLSGGEHPTSSDAESCPLEDDEGTVEGIGCLLALSTSKRSKQEVV